MERQFWTPEQEEPNINLTINGESAYELNRLNSTLHSFLGRLAVYNHVFYHGNDEEDDRFYIFNFQKHYSVIEDYMLKNDYPAILNQTSVSQLDQEAYIRSATRGLEEGYPEEWNDIQ